MTDWISVAQFCTKNGLTPGGAEYLLRTGKVAYTRLNGKRCVAADAVIPPNTYHTSKSADRERWSKVVILMPDAMVARMAAVQAREHRNRSDLIREALRRYIAASEQSHAPVY